MLELGGDDSDALWKAVADVARRRAERMAETRASPQLDGDAVRGLVASYDLESGAPPDEAVRLVADAMWEHQVHPPHPRYFGLYNPAATEAGAAGDALAAVFNPNLAAWSHSPFGTEVERRLAREIGGGFGLNPQAIEGVFTSGGAEANHTALLVALLRRWPTVREKGVRALPGAPVFYVSAECHHSFIKAARCSGLGEQAVRLVPIDEDLRMNPEALDAMIEADRAAGLLPFMVVATAGTTNAGVIDPLEAVAEIAARRGLWYHLDAAWAGAVSIVPELRPLLAGSQQADSITVDIHKWLSAPMGAGLVLTAHPGALLDAFSTVNEYMPREASAEDSYDLYQRSMQWSRRFYGLKLFLSVLTHGWGQYRATVLEMMRRGRSLRRRLDEAGWRLLNRTDLPIACFDDRHWLGTRRNQHLEAIRQAAFDSGRVWISTTRLAKTTPALRACITNRVTSEADLDVLLDTLERARGQAGSMADQPI